MSIYQKSVWFVKGFREYTKGGYLAAEKTFSAKDLDVDAKGRSYLITGANSGIGKAAAIQIAKKGGTVHMLCRNEERAQKAKEEIISTSGNQDIHVHILDSSKLADVHNFTSQFSSDHESLNVLVNNAGCMVNDRKMTPEDLEVNFATNTMGTYILTTGLLPLLKKSLNPRVVIVSSGGMLTQKLNVKDLQHEKGTFDGTMVYAQQKRQQIIIAEELALLHPDVHFSTMHPGWADTPAVQTSMPGFHSKMQGRLRTADQGADTIVWLCLSEAALSTKSGLFFQDRKPVSTHLPLAWTRESATDRQQLMKSLSEICERTRPK